MQIDFKKLFIEFLPLSLRKPLLKSFLITIGMLFNQLLNTITNWYNRQKYELAITPQVCYLEKALNDQYDPISRSIHIVEPERIRYNFYFRASDEKDWYHQDTFYAKEQQFGYNTDFIVVCPRAINNMEEQIKALVRKYKLISKKFEVIYE